MIDIAALPFARKNHTFGTFTIDELPGMWDMWGFANPVDFPNGMMRKPESSLELVFSVWHEDLVWMWRMSEDEIAAMVDKYLERLNDVPF